MTTPPEEPTLAGVITLTESGLTIDGQTFPWYFASDVTITNYGPLSGVTVEIFCDEVRTEAIAKGAAITYADRAKEVPDADR